MAACMNAAGAITDRDVAPSQCKEYVLLKPHELPVGFPYLSAADGAQVSLGIVLVWTIAWGWKMLRKSI